MLSNVVEVFMHFWTELRGVKRVTVRGDINVFRGTFKFDNFYFENIVDFYLVFDFNLRSTTVHRSIPPTEH